MPNPFASWRGPAAVLLVLAVALAAAGCRNEPQRQNRSRSGRTFTQRGGQSGYCPPETVAVPRPEEVQAPAWLPVSGRTVILDPGHGGNDQGTAHFGLREKDISLDLAQRVAGQLRARGVNVVMTRTSDVFVPLPERSVIANRHPNAVFVSIHVNAAADKPQVTGVETFVLTRELSDAERGRAIAARYRDGSGGGGQALANLAERARARGPDLAATLQRSLCGRLGERDRGVKQGNLAVLRETYFGPAVLVEAGFLTNPETARRMAGDDWRRRASEALSEGICAFLQRPE